MQIAADVVRQRHWSFFRRKSLENLDKTMVPWVGHKPRKGRNVLAAVGHHRKVHKLGKAQRLKVLRDFLQARLVELGELLDACRWKAVGVRQVLQDLALECQHHQKRAEEGKRRQQVDE